MIQRDVTVKDLAKTYKNPIPEIIQTASVFSSSIYLISNNRRINAKSIMGLMVLKPNEGDVITIEAQGADEKEAADALEAFLLCRK